ncbi:MAG TPA: MerR family DNA-binding transcriptional regulator [Jatrophihabitantaceae bacterium]|nr:MerR family DNA-binding transcriptional regulator [Jatrophihabitantaceae bacterium]
MGQMTTGALARRTGLSVKAVREYADAGLIYTTGRSAAGYRLFALRGERRLRPTTALMMTCWRGERFSDHGVNIHT